MAQHWQLPIIFTMKRQLPPVPMPPSHPFPLAVSAQPYRPSCAPTCQVAYFCLRPFARVVLSAGNSTLPRLCPAGPSLSSRTQLRPPTWSSLPPLAAIAPFSLLSGEILRVGGLGCWLHLWLPSLECGSSRAGSGCLAALSAQRGRPFLGPTTPCRCTQSGGERLQDTEPGKGRIHGARLPLPDLLGGAPLAGWGSHPRRSDAPRVREGGEQG